MILLVKILMITFLIEVGWSQTTSEPSHIKPDYKFEYYVKDEQTGDFKTQEEKREGDYITGSYSVGEPNGDLRVVTYNAGQNTGFNAHVQIHPGGSPVNSNIMEKQKHLEEIMKIIPKYQLKTSFPQFDIKIIPPMLSSTTTTTTTETIERQQTENKEEVILSESTTEIKVNNHDNIMSTIVDEANKNKTKEIEYDDNKEKERIISTKGNLEKCTELCDKTSSRSMSDKAEEEGRAHIKPNEDRVQVEMEQIIRAEMQEPTSVNLGTPYQKHETIDEHGNKKYIIKPLNIDYKPLNNEEEIMKISDSIKGTNQNSATAAQMPEQSPYSFDRNVFIYPYSGDYSTWARISGTRYPEVSRAMYAQSFELRQTPKPPAYSSQPLYTTGLAFIVFPRQ